MNRTANELWQDVKFLRNRLWVQVAYLTILDNKFYASKSMSEERYILLSESAQVVLDRFSSRLKELNVNPL